MPNHSASATASTGISTSLRNTPTAGGEARPEQAFEMQAGAGHQQADGERGAAERVRDLVPDLRQRQCG